jgi:non-heme chloroperoxidase
MDTSPHKSDFVNANGIRLHYLDWGGSGPVLLFLTGLGLTAHIYDQFAPRFTDKFHVLALTRRGHGDSDYPESGYDPDKLTEDVRQAMDALGIEQAILVGHSMANVELCHFAALHPERVSKLVFLDAAYDRTAPAYKAMLEKNPMRNVQIPGLNADHYSIEEYAASIRKCIPSLGAVWNEVFDEDLLHNVRLSPEGKIVDKMSEAISQALNATLAGYKPEDSKIQAPVLSIIAINSGEYYLAPAHMTEEQKAAGAAFFDQERPQLQRELAAQFQRDVPHARIVILPHSHHYCFIKDADLVYNEMKKFLT